MVTLAYVLAVTACVAGAAAHFVVARRRARGEGRLTGLPAVLLTLGAASLVAWIVVLTQVS